MDVSVLRQALKRVTFRLDGRRIPGARSVALVGSFNGWDSATHRLQRDPDGWWAVSLTLAPGAYPYLLLVDGVPWNDPEDDGRVPSEWGGQYSVRVVRGEGDELRRVPSAQIA
jgi:hypothetical protein